MRWLFLWPCFIQTAPNSFHFYDSLGVLHLLLVSVDDILCFEIETVLFLEPYQMFFPPTTFMALAVINSNLEKTTTLIFSPQSLWLHTVFRTIAGGARLLTRKTICREKPR